MNDILLPIGSIVILNNSDNKYMITGYMTLNLDEKTPVYYDYSACEYPKGIIDNNNMMVINKNDIKQVLYKGFDCEESIKFRSDLVKAVNDDIIKNVISYYEKKED